MSSEVVLLEREDDGLAIVTLNNPAKKNAFSTAMRNRLIALFGQLNDDPTCRAIVLSGAEGNFSAGADLGGFNDSTVRACRARLQRGGIPLMREMIAGPKPLIAAVEGYAFGGGMALTAACDHVVAARDAKFCCAFTRVGFMPDMALLFSLPARVGLAKAKQLIALADVFDGVKAERLGLVDDLAEPGQALSDAKAVARRYAEGPPLAFEMVKSVSARGLEAMLQAEQDLQPYLMLSQDHLEGKRAFAERRQPKFTGQ